MFQNESISMSLNTLSRKIKEVFENRQFNEKRKRVFVYGFRREAAMPCPFLSAVGQCNKHSFVAITK